MRLILKHYKNKIKILDFAINKNISLEKLDILSYKLFIDL